METSIRVKWKDYKELFPSTPLNSFSKIFCSNFLIKRYYDKYEGFPEAQEKYGHIEEYDYEGVTRIRWVWFFPYLIPCVIINFFVCIWSTGLKHFPRITRTIISIPLNRGNLEFRKADMFWRDRKRS